MDLEAWRKMADAVAKVKAPLFATDGADHKICRHWYKKTINMTSIHGLIRHNLLPGHQRKRHHRSPAGAVPSLRGPSWCGTSLHPFLQLVRS